MEDGEFVNDDRKIADLFNTYFVIITDSLETSDNREVYYKQITIELLKKHYSRNTKNYIESSTSALINANSLLN